MSVRQTLPQVGDAVEQIVVLGSALLNRERRIAVDYCSSRCSKDVSAPDASAGWRRGRTDSGARQRIVEPREANRSRLLLEPLLEGCQCARRFRRLATRSNR